MTASPVPRGLLLAGVVLIVLTGLIHAVEAPEYLEEEAYVGVLFIANAVGAVLVAVGLLRGGPRWAWQLGLVVAGGAFVAFILSRTTGLPSFKEDEWEGLGIASLIVEGGFCLVALRALAPARSTGRAGAARGRTVPSR